MSLCPVKVVRRREQLIADKRRVITRPFMPADPRHLRSVLDRVHGLSDERTAQLLREVLADFANRHKDVQQAFEDNYRAVAARMNGHKLNESRRLLIGAYFTKEYSVESAALFNPSIVLHPEQGDLPSGACRFIMSVRATGEGHVSSIGFRSGVINANGAITFEPNGRYVLTPRIITSPLYDKHTFELKLTEMGVRNDISNLVLEELPPQFTADDLREAIEKLRRQGIAPAIIHETVAAMQWLARSNYIAVFPADSEVSERLIYPVSENESRGIEDARFVRFVDNDGTRIYYATYTAYNGFQVLPQLIETRDFYSFRVVTLNGKCAQNKGMALFPRKINDKYAMVARLDGENLFLMYSDNVHFWNKAVKIRGPEHPWEFMQIGNCGSPLETDEGWILITHGVGPMRRYCIGVDLLDQDDPARVVARLDEPILIADEQEREGYVPNGVYSCGAMIHQGELIVPYAMSDMTSGIATLSVDELLSHLRKNRR